MSIFFSVLTINRWNVFASRRSITNHSKPIIHLITPTYSRSAQLADLTRLGQTLLLVDRLHWILVEDSWNKSNAVMEFVDHMRIMVKKYGKDMELTHLNERTPTEHQRRANEKQHRRPRGVAQRNWALRYLHVTQYQQTAFSEDDVIYFADDDNTYDVRLFEEMRSTRKVSVWPVGLVGGLSVEKPLIDPATGSVIGFNSRFNPRRAYPIDMAAFAISWSLLTRNPNARFKYNLPIGTLESNFLQQLLKGYRDLEPKADRCSKIYVWHTQTVNFKPTYL